MNFRDRRRSQSLFVGDPAEETMQKREQTIDLFCQEPFRVFFPAGLLLGAIGASLWILY